MKLWIWLLLLNVALFAYFKMGEPASPGAMATQEMNPEKLKLVMDEGFDGLAKKTYASRTLKNCYKWGRFTSSNLDEAKQVMADLGLQAEVVQESGTQDTRYWIYYPPLATPERAKAKAEEIKKLGIDELYIVQDKKWRNAISFGLFREERLADNLFKELKSKGVNHARKSVRNQGTATTSLLARSVAAETALALYKIRPEFVGSEVTAVACQ